MKIAFVSVLVFAVVHLQAQKNPYLEDLAALRSVVEKTPSFKAQIRGEKRDDFNALYKNLAFDTVSNQNSYKYFFNLAQLLFPIRDNHLGFYQLSDYAKFKTKERIDSFIASKEFRAYPALGINTDSLQKELLERSPDSIEGIYHYDRYYTVGLFHNRGNEYVGVILDSETTLWEKGQIAFHLYRSGRGSYKAIYSHPLYKSFLLQTNEKYRDQSLINSYFYGSYAQAIYSKRLRKTDYINLAPNSSKFQLKSINQDVQYLLIRSFQANTATRSESRRFEDSVKNQLVAPYLILDLRNNEGGAGREMKRYLALLKKYVRKGQLYVLVNNGTLSQAEIFMLKLAALKNVTTIGQTTKGMLTYGSNYGRRVKLPGGRFEVYPTDMNDHPELLKYEDHGITPRIILTAEKDWINQVTEIIQEKNGGKH